MNRSRNRSMARSDCTDGYSTASIITKQVTGAINSRSPLQEGLHRDVPASCCCCQCQKPSCKWCSLLIIWVLCIVAQMLVIIIVNSMLIDNYRTTATHSKYLLLSPYSTYTLPIDSTRYGALNFLYTDNDNAFGSVINYIITANSDSDHSQSVQYTRDNYECSLPNDADPFDCFIIRHWPRFYEPDRDNSYIECDSNGKSFLVWQWFPFKMYDNADITDYNIACRDRLPHVLECDNTNNDKLYASKILDNRKHDNDSIVVMRFCTQEDYGDIIQYTAVFNEHRPVFNQPYNQLIMSYYDTDSAIIPLNEYDQAINIVVNETSDGEPVEIEVQFKANLDRLIHNEIIAYVGCAVVIATIVLSVVLCPLLTKITAHFLKTKESFKCSCVLVATFFITAISVISILVVNSIVIYHHNNIPPTVSKYLSLPSNGNWELSQDKYTLLDSDKYNAMEFSFTNPSAETDITFILGSIDYEMSSYTRENILCSTTRDSSYISDDCTIVQYWPYENGDGDADSYIQCQSNVNGQNDGPFLVWEWFPLIMYDNPIITDYNIDCGGIPDQYFDCDSYNEQLSMSDVTQYRDPGESILVMRFCTSYDVDVIMYTTVFHDIQPFLNEPPYNHVTMNADRENVVVPLPIHDEDDVYMIINGPSNGEPVEIELQLKANFTTLQDNEEFAYYVAIGVLVVSGLSCIAVIILLYCLLK